MTRPHIVRADTIDLQDQTSPSAQDHSHKPRAAHQSNGVAAPHQAAELRHVKDERAAEQEHLSHAWHAAHDVGLSDEPPSDDESSYVNGHHGPQNGHQNGHQNGSRAGVADAVGGGGDDDADVDGDDGLDEDDMMDKISSSPSIDDGVFNVPIYPDLGPKAREAAVKPIIEARPATPPRPAPLHSDALDSSRFLEFDESSPLAVTPPHPPLGLWRGCFAHRGPGIPDGGREPAGKRPATPFAAEEDLSSSPFASTPPHLPLVIAQDPRTLPRDHHRTGEYKIPGIDIEALDEGYEDQSAAGHWTSLSPSYARQESPLGAEALKAPSSELNQHLQPDSQLVRSESDIALENELLPLYDPLLENDEPVGPRSYRPASPKPAEDDGWETESDDSFYDNEDCSEFSLSTYRNDDDPQGLPPDPRFVDSGWGGECLRETEDIDFDFVYALHTFVATVEGQANATKGDTMVLLDDSNSYWWLVRVVKDSTIGYLPAEHIETPTERLARLNKHRNIDLSAMMLGDTTEKTKNPLKKAMRRRNAKTVTFGGLSYVEASDYEFSCDEDDEPDKVFVNGEHPPDGEGQGGAVQDPEDDEIVVAPLNVGPGKKDMRSTSPDKALSSEETNGEDVRRKGVDEDRTSDELFNRQFESQGPKKSRNGNIRNTDSFFKDETVETRKITLTPNLLRDDSNSGAVKLDTKSRGSSFEAIERELQKPRDDKKRKEKKPGMLSGIFKRNKDKKPKGEGVVESPQKASEELSRDSASTHSEEISPVEKSIAESVTSSANVQRKPSKGKLQKSPPGATIAAELSAQKNGVHASHNDSEATLVVDPQATTTHPLSPDRNREADKPSLRVMTPDAATEAPEQAIHRIRSASDSAKPERVKAARTREALDVDSSPDGEVRSGPFVDQRRNEQRLEKPKPEEESEERLSDSPVHITSEDAQPDSEPPALVGDNSSNSSTDELTSIPSSPSPPALTATITNPSSHLQPAVSPISPAASESQSPISPVSPLMTAASASANMQSLSQPSSLAPPPPNRSPPPQPGASPSSPLPPTPTAEALASLPARNNSTSTTASTAQLAWSDASLRHYLDSTGTDDIRDLLLVVHDTTGVAPVGPEHELMRDLFLEERGKVRDLNSELDGLLTGWLARKRERAGKRTPLGFPTLHGRG